MSQPAAPAPTSPGVAHVMPAVLGMSLGGIAVGTTEFATMGLLPQIAQGTGVSIPTAGNFVTAYAIGVVVGAPLLAVLTARLPRKGVLLGLMALFTVAHVSTLFAHTYWQLMAIRFLSGLPHGAYFGIAAVTAANMVAPERRAQIVSLVLGGLSVAQVVGVPLATVLGQHAGWRWSYVVVGLLGALTMLTVALFVPRQDAEHAASARREMSALARPQVWLTLAIGMVGFGGMFATLSFITPTMTTLAHIPMRWIPFVLVLNGLGSTLGMVFSGRLARGGAMRGIILALLMIAIWLALFGFLAHHWWTALPGALVLGLLPSLLVPMLQTRLMEVAGEGQNLAAALIHSALNLANAFGAWLGSVVLAAGYGYEWPSRAGALLALTGLAIAAVAGRLDRRPH